MLASRVGSGVDGSGVAVDGVAHAESSMHIKTNT
jgi:hypothetical protein